MSKFADAVELTPAERPAFLARACGTDAELKREVESLLAAHDGDATFLESTVAVAADRNAQDLGARLQTADIVLAHDNFASIVAAVEEEGRSSTTFGSSCASCSRRTSEKC